MKIGVVLLLCAYLANSQVPYRDTPCSTGSALTNTTCGPNTCARVCNTEMIIGQEFCNTTEPLTGSTGNETGSGCDVIVSSGKFACKCVDEAFIYRDGTFDACVEEKDCFNTDGVSCSGNLVFFEIRPIIPVCQVRTSYFDYGSPGCACMSGFQYKDENRTECVPEAECIRECAVPKQDCSSYLYELVFQIDAGCLLNRCFHNETDCDTAGKMLCLMANEEAGKACWFRCKRTITLTTTTAPP